MDRTATFGTSFESFAAYDQPVVTALRGYGVSSGETMQDVRPLPQRGPTLLRTAGGDTLAVGIAGEPMEARAWSRDFATDHDIGALRQSDRRSVLSSEIMAYRHLPRDWDGEDGIAPSKEAIGDALAFVDLLPLRTQLPKPTVSGDGEVGLYWKTSSGYVDVGFFGDGKISYYGRVGNERPETGGTRAFNRTSLPKDLLEIISWV